MPTCEDIDRIVAESEAPGFPRDAQQHLAECNRCARLYASARAVHAGGLDHDLQLLDRLDSHVASLISEGKQPVGRSHKIARLQAVASRMLVPAETGTSGVWSLGGGGRPRVGRVNEMPRWLLGDPIPERPGRRRLRLAEVNGWMSELNSIRPSSEWTPEEILENAEPGQVQALCEAIGLSTHPTPSATGILDAIGRMGGTGMGNLVRALRRRRLGSVGLDYDQIVRGVAGVEKLTYEPHEPSSAIEEKIIRNRFVRIFDQLDEDTRSQVLQEFERIAASHGRHFRAEAGVAGMLALANASGFGVYMLASSLVGSVSSLLGVTLSFGFYMGMSGVIAAAIPGGLAAVGALALYKAQGPNRRKITIAVLHIAAMRLYLQDRLSSRLSELRARQIELSEPEIEEAAEEASEVLGTPPRSEYRWIGWALLVGAAAALIAAWLYYGG